MNINNNIKFKILKPVVNNQTNEVIKSSIESTKIHAKISYNDPLIKNYLIEDYPIEKERRYAIYLQEFENENPDSKFDKSLSNINKTNFVFLDFDFKGEEIKKQFLKDYKFSGTTFNNFEEALEDLYEELKKDEHTYLIGYSSSGKGLRYITCVDYPVDEKFNGQDKIVRHIHKRIVKKTIHYLRNKFNLKIYNNSEKDYIDTATYNPTQPTFSVSKGEIFTGFTFLKIEEDLYNDFIYYNEIEEAANNLTSHLRNDTHIEVDPTDNQVENMAKQFDSYNFPIIVWVAQLKEDKRKKFYNIASEVYKNNHLYEKGSVPFDNFYNFNKYINSIARNYRNMIRVGEVQTNENKKDVFNYRYTEVLNYETYINESSGISEEIYDYIETKESNSVVLKAEAGAGKTTLILQYIKNRLQKGSLVVVSAPKNVILKQFESKVNDNNENKEINILKNFQEEEDNKRDLKPEDIDGEKINLILTSYASLSKLSKINDFSQKIDLLFMDEAHNLVDQANFDHDKSLLFKDIKKIYISATPETLMNVLDDNRVYLYLERTNKEKQMLDIILHNRDLYSYFINHIFNEENNQLIYVNNKNKAEEIKNKLNEEYGIDATIFSSENKDSQDFKQLLYHEMLNNSHVITTEIVNEGVNIHNLDYELVIIDDRRMNFFNIYQLSNRFRKIKNLKIKYLINPLSYNFINRKTFNLEREYKEDLKYYNRIIQNTDRGNIVREGEDSIFKYNMYNNLYVDIFMLNNIITMKYFEIIRSNSKLFLDFFREFFTLNFQKHYIDENENYGFSNTAKMNEVKEFLRNNYYYVKYCIDNNYIFNNNDREKFIIQNFKKFKELLNQYDCLVQLYHEKQDNPDIESLKKEVLEVVTTPNKHIKKEIIKLRVEVSSKNNKKELRSDQSNLDFEVIKSLMESIFKYYGYSNNKEYYVMVESLDENFKNIPEDIERFFYILNINNKTDLKTYFEALCEIGKLYKKRLMFNKERKICYCLEKTKKKKKKSIQN